MMENRTTARTTARAPVRCPFCDRLNTVDVLRAQDRPRCGECGRPLLLDRPVHMTDRDFERTVRDAEVPLIVDFHADWCGPCRVMAPILDDLARERMGRVLVTKLDTDRNPETTARFAITGIPTLIVFAGGGEVAREVGAVPAVRLRALVDRVLEEHAPAH
jgi:thioredoxin 2